jgi:hypothetical protein
MILITFFIKIIAYGVIIREFPLSWMQRHLDRFNMKIIKSKNFTILHSEDSIRRQLRVAQSKLNYMPNPVLRNGVESYLNDLE